MAVQERHGLARPDMRHFWYLLSRGKHQLFLNLWEEKKAFPSEVPTQRLAGNTPIEDFQCLLAQNRSPNPSHATERRLYETKTLPSSSIQAQRRTIQIRQLAIILREHHFCMRRKLLIHSRMEWSTGMTYAL